MTSAHCCGADRLFDRKRAQKQLKRYIKKGPDNSTRRLIGALSVYDKTNKTLLDIGGGIGAIPWNFLENKGVRTTDVDASSGYLDTARSYAKDQGWETNTSFIQGDLTEMASELPVSDFVTMDKVVCCFPDYELLLNAALSRCNTVFALTFPLGGPLARAVNFFSRLYLKLQKNPFRSYIHSSSEINRVIVKNGFKQEYSGIAFPWRVWVYKRV